MREVKKILCFTGTRADFGLMNGVLKKLHHAPDFEVEMLATGMHLMPEFGLTLKEVQAEEYPCHVLEAVFEKDQKASMAAFLGEVVTKGTALVESIQPDYLLLPGDRAEMLAGAIIGAYGFLPTIHVGGGDVTSTIDNAVRYAITRLAHIHFAPSEASRQRLIEAGEEPWRCFNSGAPALDTILSYDFKDRAESFGWIGLQPDLTTQLVIFHPESVHSDIAGQQMATLLEAILHPDRQTVIIYPNADAGGRKMIEVIEQYQGTPHVHIFPSLPYEQYLHVLRHADVLIGNSSSGVLEAPSFGIPVLNVGDRQRGREQATNHLNVPVETETLQAALSQALTDETFRAQARVAVNPYGNGQVGEIILNALRETNFDDRWLQK